MLKVKLNRPYFCQTIPFCTNIICTEWNSLTEVRYDHHPSNRTTHPDVSHTQLFNPTPIKNTNTNTNTNKNTTCISFYSVVPHQTHRSHPNATSIQYQYHQPTRRQLQHIPHPNHHTPPPRPCPLFPLLLLTLPRPHHAAIALSCRRHTHHHTPAHLVY